MTIVLVLFVLTVAVFITDRIAIEVRSLLLVVLLVLFGALDPDEAFLGFASSAVIMIAAVMLLSGAMIHNGAMEFLLPRPRALEGDNEGGQLRLCAGDVLLWCGFDERIASRCKAYTEN